MTLLPLFLSFITSLALMPAVRVLGFKLIDLLYQGLIGGTENQPQL